MLWPPVLLARLAQLSMLARALLAWLCFCRFCECNALPDVALPDALRFRGSASGMASRLNDALPPLPPSVLPLLHTEPATLPACEPAAAVGAAVPLPLPLPALPLLLLPSAALGRGGICRLATPEPMPLPAGAAAASVLGRYALPSKLLLALPCRSKLLPLLQSLPLPALYCGGRGGSRPLAAACCCCCGCPARAAGAAAPAAAADISWLPLLDSVQPLLLKGM